jgi:predicted nucleotidyltransferase component of viral defense system
MSDQSRPKRRWGTEFQLRDLLDQSQGSLELATRDFGLLMIVEQLSAQFPSQLVFKGGFVLRHVHGILRFSSDVDSTRHQPARHKLDADDVAAAIRGASVKNIIRFNPQLPATDTANSLDFDHVKVSGSDLPDTVVQVEISYREQIVDEPEVALVGPPFYEEFQILAMAKPEIAAEKMRTFAQRIKPTDLADLAEMFVRYDINDDDTVRLAKVKFELVKPGIANRLERIERNLDEMGADYDTAVKAVFPEALSYREALDIVWPRIKPLIP